MLFFYIVARAISVCVAFLYPGYQTFKTLANRPGYEGQSARWLMYWAVISFIVAYEYALEGIISWFPFYHETKTLFLLFLVLPQIQGSTILYSKFIMPALLQHEALIDQQLASLQTNVLRLVENNLGTILKSIFGWQAAAAAAEAQQGPRGIPGLGGSTTTPMLGTPAAVPAQPNPYEQPNAQPAAAGVAAAASAAGMVQGLWNAYGPTVMATGASLLRPTGASDPAPRGAGGANMSTMPRPQNSQAQSSVAPNAYTQMPQPFIPPQQIPLPRSTSNLPEHPSPLYTTGYSEVQGR